MGQNEKQSAQQMSVILSSQIVHELRLVPRGTVPEETILLLETAYRLSTALEDVLKSAAKSAGKPRAATATAAA